MEIPDTPSKELIQILQTPPRQRTQAIVDYLVRSTSHLPFFQQITTREGSQTVHYECCKTLTLSHYQQGTFVYQKGDEADAMYIVLQGSLQILAPLIQDSHYSQLSENPSRSSLMGNQPLTLPPPLHTQSLLTPSVPNLIRPNMMTKQGRMSVLKPDLSSLIVHLQGIQENELEGYYIQGILTPGQTFGSEAMENSENRSVSVKCQTEVTLAVLQKIHFQLISCVNQKPFIEKMIFLKGLPAFKHWTKISLQKLCLGLTDVHLKRGKVLYKEGDLANTVYFIKSGQIQMSKAYTLNLTALDPPAPYSTKGELLRRRTQKKRTLAIVIKSQGELFGFQEILSGETNREFTSVCITPQAQLLVVSDSDFLKKVTQPETKRLLENHTKLLKEWTQDRLQNLKTTETLKEKMSFTPQSEIVVTRRTLSQPKPVSTQRFVPVHQKTRPFPSILGKLFTPRSISKERQRDRKYRILNREQDISRREMKSMFQTELPLNSSYQEESPPYVNQPITYNELGYISHLPKIK